VLDFKKIRIESKAAIAALAKSISPKSIGKIDKAPRRHAGPDNRTVRLTIENHTIPTCAIRSIRKNVYKFRRIVNENEVGLLVVDRDDIRAEWESNRVAPVTIRCGGGCGDRCSSSARRQSKNSCCASDPLVCREVADGSEYARALIRIE